MVKQTLSSLFSLALIASLLTGCASLSGLQDGRTAGSGNGELAVSLNVNQSPQFNKLEGQVIDSVSWSPHRWPNLELSGRYGIGEKVDIGLRVNTNTNLALFTKIQLVGDRESPFALSVGADIGTLGVGVVGGWNIQVPVYMSVHPTDKFAVYVTPRYIHQSLSLLGVSQGLDYEGGNAGILFGKRNKFGIDFGYYNMDANGRGYHAGLFQIGIGGRFAFGGNREEDY